MAYQLEGERATWPQIERIRNHSRISTKIERCLIELKKSATGERLTDGLDVRRVQSVS